MSSAQKHPEPIYIRRGLDTTMKSIRITGSPDPEHAPELFDILAISSFVSETRLYDWNLSRREAPTALLEVDGDIERFRHEISGVDGIQSIDVTPVSDDTFIVHAVLKPAVVPLLEKMLEWITREGVVVVKPIVYRDGRAHARIVGQSDVLQETVRNLPSEMNLEVTSIGDFDRSRNVVESILSDRQREAILSAFDLGYYEYPRQATHEDVADRLDCAPSTASVHLQKAEMKVISEVLERVFEW